MNTAWIKPVLPPVLVLFWVLWLGYVFGPGFHSSGRGISLRKLNLFSKSSAKRESERDDILTHTHTYNTHIPSVLRDGGGGGGADLTLSRVGGGGGALIRTDCAVLLIPDGGGGGRVRGIVAVGACLIDEGGGGGTLNEGLSSLLLYNKEERMYFVSKQNLICSATYTMLHASCTTTARRHDL